MTDKRRKVLIAMDGSDHSNATFDWYMKNLRHSDDHVLLVWNVDTLPSSYGNVNLMTGDPDVISRSINEHATHVNHIVKTLQQKLTDSNVSGCVLQLHGHSSGEAIIKASEREAADMIVVGSRGLGTLRRTFLGSVSDFVLHHAHIPVCICRFDKVIK